MAGARWQRAVAAGLVALGAAACANSPGPTTHSSVTLVPPIPSTTTTTPLPALPAVAAAPTTTRPPTTTTAPPPTTTTTKPILGPSGCPPSTLTGTGLPAGSFDVTQASLDIDGDHRTDQMLVYAVPSPDGSPFRLRVVLATTYTVETELASVAPVSAQAAASEGPPTAFTLGGFDVAGRGHDMAFVQVDQVGSDHTDAIYDLTGCGLVPVTDSNRHTMDLVVGGNTNRYDAFGCGRDANSGVPFVQTESAVSIDDGANYNLTTTIFGFTKDQLIQSQTESTTYQPPAGSSSAPPQMTTLACGQWGSVGSPNTPPTTTTTTTSTTSTTTAGTTTTVAPTTTTTG